MKSINKTDFNNQKLLNILYIIESFLFLLLCFFFVPKIDDVIFKYNEFFQFTDFKGFIHSVVYYGNGRFLGNGLGILFSKTPKLFYFVEFILVQIFCFAVEKLAEIKNAKLFCLTTFLLQPIFFVNQIESWLCGFVNYFIPILLLVFILLILKKSTDGISASIKAVRAIAIIILGFAEQFFVQHNAVMNLVIAVTILAVYIYKKKNIFEPLLIVISNLAGTALLFGYKFYIDFSQTWVYKYIDYTQGSTVLTYGSLGEKIKILISNGGLYIYVYFACIVLYTILMAVILHMDKKDKSIKFKKINVALMLLYYPAAALVFAFCVMDRLNDMRFGIIAVMLFVLNIIGFGYSFIKAVFLKMPLKLKITSAIILLYAVASAVPFFIYTTLGAYRGVWFAYNLLCLFVLIIADFARKEYGFNFDKQLVVFSVCACLVTAVYIPSYAVQRQIYNFKSENYKTEYYLPAVNKILVDQDMAWEFAEDNIEHEFIPYKEFKEMQKNNQLK